MIDDVTLCIYSMLVDLKVFTLRSASSFELKVLQNVVNLIK